VDALQGTAGNDTFNGVLQGDNGVGGAAGTTIAPGDSINGGAGTDSLVISVAGNNGDYTLSAVQTESVERVVLNNFDTNANGIITVATDLMNGLTTVGLQASSETADTAFTGMRALVGAEMRNGAGDLTLTYASAAVAGTADTQALTVSNLSDGTFTANGAETIAITSELVKSSIENVNSTTLKTITIAGAADLEIRGDLAFASVGSAIAPGAVVDASAFTGNLEITLGNQVMNVKGGSGDDIINVITLTKDDVIDGGAGDDALVIYTAAGNPTFAVGTADEKGALYNVSNIETIVAALDVGANATFNLDNTVGVTTAAVLGFVKTVDFNGRTVAANGTLSFTLNGETIVTNWIYLLIILMLLLQVRLLMQLMI
jgi:trimeric autotransporter adhesin